MLKIRPLQAEDKTAVFHMATAMYAESPRFNVRTLSYVKTEKVIDFFISNPSTGRAFVAEYDGVLIGMIGGVIVEHFFSEDTYATDLVVYVKPDRRGSSAAVRLIKAFEQWAFSVGVDEVLLGVSTGINQADTVRIYERLGYKVSSNSLIKTKGS